MKVIYTAFKRKQGLLVLVNQIYVTRICGMTTFINLGLFCRDKDLPLKPFSSCHTSCFSSLLWYFDSMLDVNHFLSLLHKIDPYAGAD